MNKWVISDLHFGHENIIKYANGLRGGTNSQEHDEWLIQQWNSVVKKNDLVYVLGDAAMNLEAYKNFKKMKGQKHLVRGNHDINNARHLLDYFCDISGIIRLKGTFWATHVPIHPGSLRGLYNLHGHLHQNNVLLPDGPPDERYINCCVEKSYGIPQNLDELLLKYKPLVEANKETLDEKNKN